MYCPGAARPFSTISLLTPPVLLGLALRSRHHSQLYQEPRHARSSRLGMRTRDPQRIRNGSGGAPSSASMRVHSQPTNLGQEALPQQLALHELELLHKARVGRCRRVATPNKLNRILEGPALLFHQVMADERHRPRNPAGAVHQDNPSRVGAEGSFDEGPSLLQRICEVRLARARVR